MICCIVCYLICLFIVYCRCISNTKAHKTAKKRRDSTMSAVAELADLLPLPDGTDPGKLKTNHILRLVVKYIHIKHLIQNSVIPTQNKLCSGRVGSSGSSKSGSAQDVPKKKPHAFELLGLSSNDVLSVSDRFSLAQVLVISLSYETYYILICVLINLSCMQ